MNLVNFDCTFIDYPSPTDWANIYYFSGCSHFCKSCQNQELQNCNVGNYCTVEALNTLISTNSKKNQTNKVVFSGGDPLHPHNINDIKYFLQLYGSLYDICIYTGYDIDYVKQNEITNFKFIKCGKFDETTKRESGNFEDRFILASPNQNFYDSNYRQISKEGILIY